MYRYFVFILKIYKLKFKDSKETHLKYIKTYNYFFNGIYTNQKKL